MLLKTSKEKIVTYLLICVFVLLPRCLYAFQCFQCLQNLFVKKYIEFKTALITSFILLLPPEVFCKKRCSSKFCKRDVLNPPPKLFIASKAIQTVQRFFLKIIPACIMKPPLTHFEALLYSNKELNFSASVIHVAFSFDIKFFI